MGEDVDVLVGELELDEVCALVSGIDTWSTPGNERLGIGRLITTDGPNGARGSKWAGLRAACFPSGSAIGATWDVDLVGRLGAALGVETRRKGAHLLLAPTVNLHRHPLGGRHFECMSEDPVLSARLAVAYINGVQSEGVGCTVKHFVANDSEYQRMTISSDVDERTLRELYLVPFEAAVKEAGTWAVMSSYNRINGTYAAHNSWLLEEVLRGEWGFDGIVMSDWFGTYDTVGAALGGLDVEMPGPPQHWGSKLADAVRSGAVPEETVRRKARNVLRVLDRAGGLYDRSDRVEEEVDDATIDALVRTAGAAAMVLLRNEGGALPIDPAAVRSIALLGPNAVTAQIQGGGSAGVTPYHAVSPVDGLRAALAPHGVDLVVERGCAIHKRVPAIDRTSLDGDLVVTYSDLTGREVHVERFGRGHFMWFGPSSSRQVPSKFTARITGTVLATETGDWTFTATVAGRARLYVDGVLVADAWDTTEKSDAFFGYAGPEVAGTVAMEAGRTYDLVAEYSTETSDGFSGLTIGCLAPQPADMFDRAVAAAAAADAVVVVVGTTSEWESEGHDRTTLDLPGRQVELVRAAVAANPRTIVVINAGSPVDVNWADEVPGVLVGWFSGQEWGHALADVLLGVADPGGRLPTTWPRRLEDTPAFTSYPGEEGHVRYGEGVFSGHRWYDARRIEPAYCFGHGLSYTTFAYGTPTVAAADDDVVLVTVPVTNTGDRPGSHVVQCYVRDVVSSVSRPVQELKAFGKVSLDPGATGDVVLRLDRRAFAYWSVDVHDWVVEPGEFQIRLGGSSRDIREVLTVTR
jgi:beta-glucosidase